MSSSTTNQAQQSQGGSGILERDHFVSPPYDLARGEEVGSDAAAAAQRQHLAERRKPDRYIPREKGSKAGRFEADMVVHDEGLLDGCISQSKNGQGHSDRYNEEEE
ncbi:hypothetical protein KJ359_007645 [Pestalotiopsis sp. 9143b]|nr:hypothetical protein KJ359_007645 [Pestalotiopsis sp. 9143b]